MPSPFKECASDGIYTCSFCMNHGTVNCPGTVRCPGCFRHVPDLERHHCNYPTPSTLRDEKSDD